MKKQRMNAYTLAFTGVMAAIVYVVTLFRFPLLGSKVHFANAMCLLSGLLLGGVPGGIAAGPLFRSIKTAAAAPVRSPVPAADRCGVPAC